jgi:hypothetical protein
MAKIEDETIQEYLEALLNVGVQVAHLQYDDVSQAGMIKMIEDLADYFDIPRVYIEEHVVEDEAFDNIASTLPEDPDGTVH